MKLKRVFFSFFIRTLYLMCCLLFILQRTHLWRCHRVRSVDIWNWSASACFAHAMICSAGIWPKIWRNNAKVAPAATRKTTTQSGKKTAHDDKRHSCRHRIHFPGVCVRMELARYLIHKRERAAVVEKEFEWTQLSKYVYNNTYKQHIRWE